MSKADEIELWFNIPEKFEFIDEDIIKKCKESRLPEGKDFILERGVTYER